MSKDLIEFVKLLNSKDKEKVISSVGSLIELKREILQVLIKALVETKDNSLRKLLILSIVDNFKDERIIPILKQLITDNSLKSENAIFVYALGEYSNSNELLEFLVDLVLNYEYHVAWNALNIIISMSVHFNELEIKNLLKNIDDLNEIDDEKKMLIHDLRLFLESQVTR